MTENIGGYWERKQALSNAIGEAMHPSYDRSDVADVPVEELADRVIAAVERWRAEDSNASYLPRPDESTTEGNHNA